MTAPVKLKTDVVIRSSSDLANYLRSIWDEGIEIYESFYAVYLNRANKIIGWMKVSQGGITGTVADPRLVVKKAIDILAVGIIVSHNHPSGNLNPSGADKQMTKKLKEGCAYFDITVLDHIILTSEGHYSFFDNGEL